MQKEGAKDIYKKVLNDAEGVLLEEALRSTKGNKSKAARMLGINRLTLLRKLKEYGLGEN
jgi:DNA-binding protein Fis